MIPSELVTSKPRAINYIFLAFFPTSNGWNCPRAAIFFLEKVPVVTRSVGSMIYIINNKKGRDFLVRVLPDCRQWHVASREKEQGQPLSHLHGACGSSRVQTPGKEFN